MHKEDSVSSLCPKRYASVSVGVDNVETSGALRASLPSGPTSMNQAAVLAETVGNVHIDSEKIKSHRELERERRCVFPSAEQTRDGLIKPGKPPEASGFIFLSSKCETVTTSIEVNR